MSSRTAVAVREPRIVGRALSRVIGVRAQLAAVDIQEHQKQLTDTCICALEERPLQLLHASLNMLFPRPDSCPQVQHSSHLFTQASHPTHSLQSSLHLSAQALQQVRKYLVQARPRFRH